MDHVIAISQGLGLAAAAGLLATIVIAAGGSGEVGTAGEPRELGGSGGSGGSGGADGSRR